MDRYETQIGITRNNGGEWVPCPVKQAEETMTVAGTVSMLDEHGSCEWVVEVETDLSRFAAHEAVAIREWAETSLMLKAEAM